MRERRRVLVREEKGVDRHAVLREYLCEDAGLQRQRVRIFQLQ